MWRPTVEQDIPQLAVKFGGNGMATPIPIILKIAVFSQFRTSRHPRLQVENAKICASEHQAFCSVDDIETKTPGFEVTVQDTSLVNGLQDTQQS